MSKSQHNPEIRNPSSPKPRPAGRRSIRLKSHDYAGGGLYFVTLCAHREFIQAAKGKPFGESGARQASPERELIEERMRIWHRNDYEMIVRTPEAEKNIRRYIQMNPWRCVQQFGNGLRGMGNPSLWNLPRLGILCSHKGDMHVAPTSIPKAEVYLSGFHSPMEKEIFAKLLELKKPIIWCPAWGLERAAFAPGIREALEEKRWLPHVACGGMIDRLLRETDSERKRFNH